MRQGITIVFLIALAWSGLVLAETATPELLFQKALHMETAKGDYRGAIPVYEEIVKTQEANAQWASKALYRMGLCWEKIGDQQKAAECARNIEDKYASVIPENADMQMFVRKYSKKGAVQGEEKLRRKLETIVIKKLEFNDAELVDVLKYLHQTSVASDTNSPVGERGVNFTINLKASGGTVLTNMPPRLTLEMRDVSLADVIKYITEISGLKYRLENNGVVITPDEGPLQARTYKFEFSTISVMVGTNYNQSGSLKEFFINVGIPFPEGSSITYIPNQNMVIAVNTVDNLNKMEKIWSKLNVPTMQVKVDVQLIEIIGEQAASMGNKQIITRADLEKIPTNQIRYISRLSVVTKNGVNANAKNTRLPLIGDREIGTYFNVTPMVSPDNETIDLKFAWQSTDLAGGTNAGGKANSDPVIVKKEINADCKLWDQQSMVMQIQRESDSTGGSGIDSKQYLIITAVLVDPAGNAINKKAETVRAKDPAPEIKCK